MPDGGFLAVEHAAQIAHVFHAGLAALDLNDDLLRLGGFRVVSEKDFSVNAVVRAFFWPRAARADEAEAPTTGTDNLSSSARVAASLGVVGSPDDADEGDDGS